MSAAFFMILLSTVATSQGAAYVTDPGPSFSLTGYEYADDDAQDRDDESEDTYEEATNAIDEEDWREAVRLFDRVISRGGTRADGAMYWKAYAQAKLGQRTEALETLAAMMKKYPKSRWINDNKALDLEIRQASGQRISPEGLDDDELKLIALHSLIGKDPQRAMPILEKILQGSAASKVKEQALFVLAQSDNERAHAILTEIALGRGNPDLQARAIKYLGINPTERNRSLLSQAYQTGSIEVKKAALEAFMIAGDRARILEAARSEKDETLRAVAVQQLGVLGSKKELSELYRTESSRRVKKSIIQAMFVGNSAESLQELARIEKDIELRAEAVKHLGLLPQATTEKFLLSLYQTEQAPEIRGAVVDAFFVQGNARVLVQLVRQEKDRRMKREIAEKLAIMDDPEAVEYMQELLNQ
jgi:HEAT repeat protein